MAWTERYVRDDAAGGGNGTTNTNTGTNGAWTLTEAVASYAAGQRLNVRAGIYASGATNRILSTAGTTTAPVWWRGFAVTPGDLDDVPDGAASGPQLTFTSGRFLINAVGHIHLSSLSLTSQDVSTGGTLQITGGPCSVDRCRLENTAVSSAGKACQLSSVGGAHLTRSWLRSTASASEVLMLGNNAFVSGCSFHGGGHGVNAIGGQVTLHRCVFNDNGADGIRAGGAAGLYVIGCSFYSPGSDGVDFNTMPGTLSAVSDCVFNNSAGYNVNNSSGTNTGFVRRYHNTSYLFTSGAENGFGDTPALSGNQDAAASFVNASGADFSLVAGSVAKGSGSPGKYENQTYTGYADRGAVNRQEPAGGGGGGGVGVLVSSLNSQLIKAGW